jgi:hypothetical protein
LIPRKKQRRHAEHLGEEAGVDLPPDAVVAHVENAQVRGLDLN